MAVPVLALIARGEEPAEEELVVSSSMSGGGSLAGSAGNKMVSMGDKAAAMTECG